MQTEAPIACTLDGASYQERMRAIERLFAQSLRGSNRTGHVLHLQFDRAARAEVEDLVRKEKQCCAFLDFDLQEGGDRLELTITVPPHAGDQAGELLAPFIAGTQQPSCACADAKRPPKRAALPAAGLLLSGGALACGVACTAPLALAGIGIGGASLAFIAAVESWRIPLLGLAGAALIVGWMLRARRGASTRQTRQLQIATAILALAASWGWIESLVVKAIT